MALNEDPNHFYHSRRQQRLTREGIASWVKQYEGTQVRELIVCVNAMRAAFRAKTRESFWSGFDPAQGPEQALFASLPAPETRRVFWEWVRCAWQMDADGLDLYSIWLPEIRRRRMTPWVSMRMNDLHDVDNEKHPLHEQFWRENPQFRRVPYREEQRDKALDYGRSEVRAYAFRFLEEICERYDFDGLELDWMRHGFHFRPGAEAAGQRALDEFHRAVRKLLDAWGKRRGRKLTLAVRVPGSLLSARRLGLDPAPWPVDFVTVTNFWRTVDTFMPIEEWRRWLPREMTLAAGLELGLNAFPGSVAAGGRAFQTNSLETVRGAAAGYWQAGAERVYLFNYMDSVTAMDDNEHYPTLLREAGEAASLAGKTRRHVVTYQDTWAPGESAWSALPAEIATGRWKAFRLLSGPREEGRRVTVWTDAECSVRFNGEACTPAGPAALRKPGPARPCFAYRVPAGAWMGGEVVMELAAARALRAEWVEVEIAPA